jgi:hypothetical protein
VPLAVNELVMAGGDCACPMVRASVAEPVPAALVALSVTLKLPAVVGVPEIRPVVVLTDSQGKPRLH